MMYFVTYGPLVAAAMIVHGEKAFSFIKPVVKSIISRFCFKGDDPGKLESLVEHYIMARDQQTRDALRAFDHEELLEDFVTFTEEVAKTRAEYERKGTGAADDFRQYVNEYGRFAAQSQKTTFEQLDELEAKLRGAIAITGQRVSDGIKIDDPAKLYKNGVAAYKAGHTEKAVRAFRACTKLSPEHVKAWKYLGLIQYAQKMYGEAIESFCNAIKIAPFDPEANIGLGLVFYEQDSDPAMRDNCFSKATPQTIFNVNPWVNIGRFLLNEKELDQAMVCFKKAIELNPEDSSVWRALVIAFRAFGDFGAARDALDNARKCEKMVHHNKYEVNFLGQKIDLAKMHELLNDDLPSIEEISSKMFGS